MIDHHEKHLVWCECIARASSRLALHTLFECGCVRSIVCLGVSICTRLVKHYKRMGTQSSVANTLKLEVTARAAIIRSGSNGMRSVVKHSQLH